MYICQYKYPSLRLLIPRVCVFVCNLIYMYCLVQHEVRHTTQNVIIERILIIQILAIITIIIIKVGGNF